MNETTGKTPSSLAITEKKTQRPGGCIGIFFQLFDWNRKLAKKKLFSKKLLPPAREKQASKKFKGDEKMPNSKLHLIANENSGGFPSAKKGGNRGVDVEQKHEKRVPGLVARLMGLESIPAAQRDKFKKASFSGTCSDGEKESLGAHCDSGRRGLNLEMGVPKHDSRPQMLQKTGTYERRAVTRFGVEALQIKSVWSRTKKHHQHHQPKFASPLKSPRITSGKNMSRSSRLIGAATKILEPGLQAASRAKSSLTYSGSIYPPTNDIVTEGVRAKSIDVQIASGSDASGAKPLMGQTSCKNCGNMIDVVDCRPDVEGQPVVPPPIDSELITASSMVSARRRARSAMTSHEQETNVVLLRSQPKHISIVAVEEGRSNRQYSIEPTTRQIPLPRNGPASWNSSRQPCRTPEDDASSVAFKHKPQTEEQMLSSERISPESRVSNLQAKRVSSTANTVSGTKDFVALNRSLSGRTRLRSHTKVDSSKCDLEKKPCKRQDDSLSRVRTLERKRRTPNVTQVASTASVNSAMVKQRNVHSDAQLGKRRDVNASSMKSTHAKSKQGPHGKTDKINDNKGNDVVSFTFNSPLKQKIGIATEKEEKSSDNEITTCIPKPLPLRGDALGAFLEQKLKELASHEEEELSTGAPPKRSTAIILQELISALSAEHLTYNDAHMVNADLSFHVGANMERSLGASFSCNGNHRSPGSILEASFSSSSLDESSGHGLQPDSVNYSYNQLEQSELDAELLDSAASFAQVNIGSEKLTDLANQISTILESLNSFGARLSRSNFTHVKDVIFNAELLLGNATMHCEDAVPHLFISRFLLDELDTIIDDAMWTDFNGCIGYGDSKERNQLKGFLFDCVIEYLESNCCQCCNCGYNSWTKLTLFMKAEMLIQQVKREIKRWACIAGMIPDEIIEYEMSHSLGKWTNFDIEAFEAGVEINGEILKLLVDEVVEDIVDCREGFI